MAQNVFVGSVAARYDDVEHLSSRSGPVGSHCRCAIEVSTSTASRSLPTWWSSSDESDTYDFANQRLISSHYWPQPDGRMTTFESHHRSAWPAELDLMAEIAGMHLVERYGDWSGAPFTSNSTQHISVWAKDT